MREGETIIEINKNDLLDTGRKRICYRHPNNPYRCLKIDINDSGLNQRDLDAYYNVSPILREYLPTYFGIIRTSKGKALETELIADESGIPSKSIYEYYISHKISLSLKNELGKLFSLLIENKIYLYDLNPKNILIQEKEGDQFIKFIDLKNLNYSNSFLQLEKIDFFGKIKMKRRIKKFNQKWLNL